MHALSRTIGFALATAVVVSSASVAAQEVAPLVPKMEPATSPEITQRFQEALAAGLRAAGQEVRAPEAVRSALSKAQGLGCVELECVRQAQLQLDTRRAATLEVRAVGKNYVIDVRLFSGSSQLSTASERCDICTIAEAIQSTEKAAAAAARAAPAAVAAELPAESPSGGQAAAEEDTAQAPGPTPAPAAAKPVASRSRQWPLWPALAAGGAGLVAIAIGVPLVSIDGTGTNCRGEPRSDYHNCEDLYQTAASGWVLTAMGAGGLAASGVLFYLYLDGRPEEQPQQAGLQWLTASPLPEGGVAVGAGGRF